MPVNSKLETKFKLLLNKFMIQDHEVIDDTCLEKLLTHLSKEDFGPELLQIPECRGFCECALHAFEKGIVGESVLSFSVRLHGLLIKNEEIFSTPEFQESTKNITLSPRWLVTNNVSLQYSFVQMVTSLLSHASGTQWLKSSVVWKTVKKLYEKNSSIYVARECQNFLSRFALKICSSNSEIAEEILKGPMDTLSSNKADMTTSLDLLITILELGLKENELDLCKMLEPRLSTISADLLSSSSENTYLVKAAKIQLLLIFCSIEPTNESLDQLEEKSMNLIKKLIVMKNVGAIQTITAQCQIYWKELRPRVEHLQRQYKYDMQIVYIQLMPVMKNKDDDIELKDCIKQFLEKLCACTSPATQSCGCLFRKLCFSDDDHQKVASRSIHSLLQLKDVLDRTTVICVFRALMCIVVQLVSSDAAEIAEIQISGLMRTTLEALIKMMDHFHFTWAESIETISILAYMQELLLHPTLEDRQISPILQIMRRAVEDFLPPDLALLTNNVEGSTLQNLGPQLYKCLHNRSWEVRDSALEVVTVMAKISSDKYPAFQEHLIQHNLCSLAAAMASGDEESYVRVSALNCLKAMVAIPEYWDKVLKNQRISEMLTTILCQDSEGIVRQEAALLVGAMFEHGRLSAEEKERMYLVMSDAAVTDFHWEVKVNALRFWELTIHQQLTSQGMVDGRFPEVTFSGSSRRIVTLDRKEIQNRLHIVLGELAKIRCLAVLLGSLHDPDLQVTRTAAEILKGLLKHLEEHELFKKNPDGRLDSPEIEMAVESPLDVDDLFDEDVPMSNSNSVIDDIIELSDMALLASVCRNQLNVSEAEVPDPTPRGINSVSADEFLRKVNEVNFDKMISNREEWLFNTTEHLESLLTDMLEAREFKHNTNKIDCY